MKFEDMLLQDAICNLLKSIDQNRGDAEYQEKLKRVDVPENKDTTRMTATEALNHTVKKAVANWHNQWVEDELSDDDRISDK